MQHESTGTGLPSLVPALVVHTLLCAASPGVGQSCSKIGMADWPNAYIILEMT